MSTSSPIAPPFSPLSASSTGSFMDCSTYDLESELDESAVTVDVQEEPSHDWCGFKIVGDNIDKNVRP